MAILLNDYLDKLSETERQAIAARTAQLVDEEATLRQSREARFRSQEEIARRLGINQASVSKLERRTDMYVSTLRSLIRAMGGELDIVARFPDHPPIRIAQFETLDVESRPIS
jgi:transcriptional regulator with XRE-family HTH domain